MKNLITAEMEVKVRRMRDAGYTYQRIADSVGISVSSAYWIVNPDKRPQSVYIPFNWNSCGVCGKRCRERFCNRHNPDAIGFIQRRKLMDPYQYRYGAIKHRANQTGILFTIEVTDMPEVPFECPVPSCSIVFSSITSDDNTTRPTIDRIDSNKGYVPGNIHWLCDRHNRIKWNASSSELIELGEYIRKVSNGKA